MKRLISFVAVGLCLLCGSASAYQDGPSPDELMRRIEQLEAETAAMREELQFSREHAQAPDGGPTFPITMDATTETTTEEPLYADQELLGEMKKLVWMSGDYKIVPYGIIWGSSIYHSQRTFPGAFTLYVFSQAQEHEDTYVLDTRRTRLGLDITGPKVAAMHNANSRGKVEIDFHGQFVTENQATIQIRHAYGEIYDDSFSILAGQTWDLTSPLQPHTVNYSIGWGGGNIGFRRMQIRGTRNLDFSDYLRITPALAICQNIVFDGPVNDREYTDWPVLEGRLGCTVGPRGDGCKPVAFGMSAHIGEQGFDFAAVKGLPAGENNRIRTWSINADVLVPITERISFQGEFFTGADLATLLGGAVQGVDFTRREAIHSTGGWLELGCDWRSDLHSYVGYGIDDPRNSDIVGDPAASVLTGRTYNHFVFTNLMYDMTNKLKFGGEVSYWRTQWQGLPPGDSVMFEFAGQYGF